MTDTFNEGQLLIQRNILIEHLQRELAAANARVARCEHDMPILHKFFDKHALGSKLAPSCLVCGQTLTDSPGIGHMELSGVVICKTCHAQPATIAEQAARIAEFEHESSQEHQSYMLMEQLCDKQAATIAAQQARIVAAHEIIDNITLQRTALYWQKIEAWLAAAPAGSK